MEKQVDLLGADGHGRRKLPSLATNLALMTRGMENAAPYVRHIGLAAPYLAAAPPDLLPGLLLPSISSPKPPAARKAPTRVNLFKAQKTLSTSTKCSASKISDGTIIVVHYGSVPPTVYLCYTAMQGDKELLIPFDTVKYQVDPASQFTYATNAAASINLEITSLAANKPLNGQITAAHVMDIDDISTYSTGSYELRSTTPKDAISSTSLAQGVVGVMGPESWTETLIHPHHCGSKTYPGWSFSVRTNRFDVNKVATLFLDEITDHRWFVDCTIEVTAIAHFNDGTDTGGILGLWVGIVKGQTPPTANCDMATRHQWAEIHSDWINVGQASAAACEQKVKVPVTKKKDNGMEETVLEEKTKRELHKIQKKTRGDLKTKLMCNQDENGKDVCNVTDDPSPCEGMTSEVIPLCCNKAKVNTTRLNLGVGGYKTLAAHGEYTTCSTEQAVAISTEWDPCQQSGVFPTCVEFHIRTRCENPQAQFGPAFVGRLEGLTEDIVIQMNVRAAVAGIQSGDARSVAPPTGPSMLALGEEDSVLTQAVFDSDTTKVARVMTGRTYLEAGGVTSSVTREEAAGMMEAAPIGDTIRSITSKISDFGRGLGGPFSTIGDIVGTVGGIAGGIGDAIGSIFAAPPPSKRPRLMAAPNDTTIYAAPRPPLPANVAEFTPPETWTTYRPPDGVPRPTPESVRVSMRENSWATALNRTLKSDGPFMNDTAQTFPYVIPDSNTGGTANVYITKEPMALPGRPKPYYGIYRHQGSKIRYYIDEFLSRNNNAAYVGEAIAALMVSGRNDCCLTTDAGEYIYGDSFAAAVLAASMAPAPTAAITGGIAVASDGTVSIRPVGEIARKIEVAADEGLTLIAPREAPLQYLRASSQGTPVVSITDIIRGTVTETPQVIYVDGLSDLALASAFVARTQSVPFSPEEKQLKEESIAKSQEAQLKVQAERDQYAVQPTDTPAQITAKRQTKFELDVPGFGKREAQLLNPAWWTPYMDIITKSAAEKGIGLKAEKLTSLISEGAVNRLRGLGLSVLSRTLSAERKAMGGKRKPAKGTGSKQPPFKRPKTSQISSLIETLRQGMADQAADGAEMATD